MGGTGSFCWRYGVNACVCMCVCVGKYLRQGVL